MKWFSTELFEEFSMSENENKDEKEVQPPRLNPFVFTILLFAFGIWCFKDGFMNSDPEYDHLLFNQVMAVIFLLGGVADLIYLLWKKKKKAESEE